MKRLIAILSAAAILAVVAFGCAHAATDTPDEPFVPAEVSAETRSAIEDFLYEYLGEDIVTAEVIIYDLENDGVPEVLIRRNRNDFVFDVFRYNPSQFTRVGEISMPLAFYRNSEEQPLRRTGGNFELISFGNGMLVLEQLDDVNSAQLSRIERLTDMATAVSQAVTQRLVDEGRIDPDATTVLTTTTTEAPTNADGTPVTTLPGQTAAATTTQAGATTTAQAAGTTLPGQTTTTTTRPPTTTAGGGGGGQITVPNQGTTAPPAVGQADQVLTTPISVQNNTAAALAQFNTSVNRIVSQNAGFSKRHQVTHPNFTASPDFAYAGFLSMANMVAPAVVHVLSNMPTGSVRERGHSTQMIRQSQLTTADLNSATAVQQGNGNWVITLNVRNSSSASPGSASTSHMARGPIHRTADPGGPMPLPSAYDHMNAAQLRTSLSEGLSILMASVSRIQENTTAARYVLTLDRNGNPINLIAIFSQTLDFDIQFQAGAGGGNSYRGNRTTYTTTITFEHFRFR